VDEERVILGRIIGVHGLLGELVVRTESDDPMNLGRYGSFQWSEPGGRKGRTRSIRMTECRVHRGAALVSFEGVEDREAAEDLVGGTLSIPRSELLPAPDDSYYVADLMGLTVVTVAGETVGPLTAVYPGGGHDVYGVDKGGREVLIPAVEPIVVDIDLATRRMTIDPPEGLLD